MKWILIIMLFITMGASLVACYFHYNVWKGYKLAKAAMNKSESHYV